MILRSFVKINLLFRIMDPLKRKSPVIMITDYDYPMPAIFWINRIR